MIETLRFAQGYTKTETQGGEIQSIKKSKSIQERKGEVDELHDFGNGDLRSFDKQVHMICHQDIVIKLQKEFLFVPENYIDMLLVVGLFLKDVLSVVASGKDMVNIFFRCYSCDSWHTGSLPTGRHIFQ